MTTYTITDATLKIISPRRVLVKGTEAGHPTTILLDLLGRQGAQAQLLAQQGGLTVSYSAKGEVLNVRA